MKLTRRQKETVGFSMIFSAITLMVSFAVIACRKRSILAALAAVAAAEGVTGYLLLTDPKPRKSCRARKGQKCADKEAEEELFDAEECREADAHIRQVLGGRHNEEAAPRVLREIPRDEDATEADFQ